MYVRPPTCRAKRRVRRVRIARGLVSLPPLARVRFRASARAAARPIRAITAVVVRERLVRRAGFTAPMRRRYPGRARLATIVLPARRLQLNYHAMRARFALRNRRRRPQYNVRPDFTVLQRPQGRAIAALVMPALPVRLLRRNCHAMPATFALRNRRHRLKRYVRLGFIVRLLQYHQASAKLATIALPVHRPCMAMARATRAFTARRARPRSTRAAPARPTRAQRAPYPTIRPALCRCRHRHRHRIP
jgi:hypothetical protein